MELAIERTLVARYDGTCKVSAAHPIRRKETIGTLVDASNPMNTVSGFACAQCVRDLPKAPRGH